LGAKLQRSRIQVPLSSIAGGLVRALQGGNTWAQPTKRLRTPSAEKRAKREQCKFRICAIIFIQPIVFIDILYKLVLSLLDFTCQGVDQGLLFV
jgi:hypothetical protein